jgi:hypothetical protein
VVRRNNLPSVDSEPWERPWPHMVVSTLMCSESAIFSCTMFHIVCMFGACDARVGHTFGRCSMCGYTYPLHDCRVSSRLATQAFACCVLRVLALQVQPTLSFRLPILLASFCSPFIVSASVMFFVGKSSYALCSLLVLDSASRVLAIFNYQSSSVICCYF